MELIARHLDYRSGTTYVSAGPWYMVDSAEEAERLYGSLDDFPGGYEVMEVTSEEALEYTGFM